MTKQQKQLKNFLESLLLNYGNADLGNCFSEYLAYGRMRKDHLTKFADGISHSHSKRGSSNKLGSGIANTMDT